VGHLGVPSPGLAVPFALRKNIYWVQQRKYSLPEVFRVWAFFQQQMLIQLLVFFTVDHLFDHFYLILSGFLTFFNGLTLTQ
jgi:hypothetical protein